VEWSEGEETELMEGEEAELLAGEEAELSPVLQLVRANTQSKGSKQIFLIFISSFPVLEKHC
jgi:hypothetical protein